MEALGIDYRLMIAQLINFALFFWLFSKFIAKPLSRYIQDQRTKEQHKDKLLADLNKQEEYLKTKEDEMLKAMQIKTDEAIRQAKIDAQAISATIVEKAKKQAESIIADTKVQIDSERQKLYAEMQQSVIQLTDVLIKQSLKDYLDESAQKKVTQQVLSNLPKAIKNYAD